MKQICVKIDEELLAQLDNVVSRLPYYVKRNKAINRAIRDYVERHEPTI